jgi:hypothetical protein
LILSATLGLFEKLTESSILGTLLGSFLSRTREDSNGKSLSDFDALVKQSYSLHESLRLVRGGRIWSPAKVSPVGSRLRVSTSTETLDILPVRVAWQGPSEFSVSGVDPECRPKRIVLRFQSAESANALATLIPSLGRPVEVASAPVVDHVPILIKFYYPRIIVALSVLGLAAWIALVVYATILYSLLGFILTFWLLNFIMRMLLGPILSNFVKFTNGNIRLEGRRITLTSSRGWFYPDFSDVKFTQSGAFVLKIGLKTVEVKFLTETDRTKALAWIRERNPVQSYFRNTL